MWDCHALLEHVPTLLNPQSREPLKAMITHGEV